MRKAQPSKERSHRMKMTPNPSFRGTAFGGRLAQR
jgi:hypothetical protein